MRVRPYERRRFRMRGWIIALIILIVVLVLSLRGLAGFYTDYLWFDSLGQSGTWGNLLAAKVIPALVFTVVFFAIMLVNLLIADRLAPAYQPLSAPTPEDEMVGRYQHATARYQGRLRSAISLFFALIAGIGVSSQWREWVLFTHRVDFGVKDPQFHRDVGFYVFTLPFLKFVTDWLFAGLVIVLLVTAAAYWLNGGIRFQTPLQRVAPQVKAHLSVILAFMALVKAAQYWLGQYELTTSDRGVTDGASYTDVHAELPALKLLLVISIVAAGLFLWNIRRRGWVLPVIAVGLWAFISLVIGTIYPAIVQEVKVGPNEFANEQQYITRNIRATRDAYGLSNITVPQQFDFSEISNPAVINANLPDLANARLWDPGVIQSTYQRIQGLQTFYSVSDVDVDRYGIGSNPGQQVVIAARDLNPAELPSQSWVNEHIVYTHGYGAIISPTNASEALSGNPIFYLKNVPPAGSGIELKGKGAQLYFGENLPGYVIVKAKSDEFNYVRPGQSDAQTRYSGKDGVKVSNIFKRAAFALRFGDINALISGQISSNSKVIFIRDVRERVSKLAPFLSFDRDPYPAVINNRVVWILDGYTTSGRYPYAQFSDSSGGIPGDVNYVRNSVKATVDAYNGTVRFYIVDHHDPLIRAYQKAFPDLFTDGKKAPDALKAHYRYPQDLFRLQSDVFGKYHVTQARRFYQGTERWLRSPDPLAVTSSVVSEGTRTGRGAQRAPEISATSPRQEPYYLNVRLPGSDPGFVLMQPYVPVSRGNQQTRLTAFITAKSDPGEYGKLEAFVMPQGTNVSGPVQVANSIDSDDMIAQQFTLLDQHGSQLVRGNIQLIPVGSSIVYVQPIYVRQQSDQGFPQFRFVIAYTDGQTPKFADTVDHALEQMFGITTPTPTPTPGPTPTPTPGNQTVRQLLDAANKAFTDAETALKQGDLAEYQRLIGVAQKAVDQALQLAGGTPSSTTTTTAP